MGRSKLSEFAFYEQRRRESSENGSRLIDLRIDVEFQGEVVISVGGRWDRREKAYVAEAESGIVVRPHPGQMKLITWWHGWLPYHAHRRENPPEITGEAADFLESLLADPDGKEVYSILAAGGRRGGKTWIAAVCCAMYAVAFPGAIVWIVNPSNEKHEEVRRYMSALLSPSWIEHETVAGGWELVNGSSLALKSGYAGADPDAIKEGEAHLIWLNEGQKMKQRVFTVARGAIVDHSGIVVVCANPPVEAKDEQWVAEFATDAQNNRRAARYFHFNPLENPHINRRALLALKAEVDIRTYRIEVLGEFLPPVDMVAYNWLRTLGGNEEKRPRPTWDRNVQVACPRTGLIDVTEEFLEKEEEGDAIRDLVGMDFQIHPHLGGPVYRFYARPGVIPHRDNVMVWGVDELVVEGDEEAWCYHALEKGYDPETTLLVGDATAEYQHTRRRSADSPPPEWHGKGSFDIIRAGGFHRIVPPSRRIRKKNPDVIDRVRSMTSMIESATGVRRFFLDPDLCPKTCQSIRTWPTVHGKPSRTHEAAHLGDAASYPLIRIFPRILRSIKPARNAEVLKTMREVDPIASEFRVEGTAPRRGRGRGERRL